MPGSFASAWEGKPRPEDPFWQNQALGGLCQVGANCTAQGYPHTLQVTGRLAGPWAVNSR